MTGRPDRLSHTVVWGLLLCLLIDLALHTADGFIFGPQGELQCQGSNRRPTCRNCRFTCRCTGDGKSTYFKVAARYRRGRCIPRNRTPLTCDRFRWCATCRTNLPERDYHGCKRYLPGAPRHH